MGKSNDSKATLRKGNLPPASKVETAKEDKGACLKAVKPQIDSNRADGGKADCPCDEK